MLQGHRFALLLAFGVLSSTALAGADPAPVDGIVFPVDSVSALGVGPSVFRVGFRDLTAVPTAFQVQYSTDPSAPDTSWRDAGPLVPARRAGTSPGGFRYTDVLIVGLPASSPVVHYFRVRAALTRNSPANATPADAVNGPWAGPDGAFLGPAPPTLVAATLSGAYPLVTWTNNATTSDLLWQGTYIYRSVNGSPYVLYATPTTTSASFLDTGVTPNTRYAYQVASYRAGYILANVEVSVSLGTPPNASVITPNAPPPPVPSAPSALGAVALSSTQIQLSWSDNSSNEDGFVIERSTDGGQNFATRATLNVPNTVSYLDKNLLPGIAYTYRVRAFNSGGQGAPSNLAAATTPSLPPPVWVSPDASRQNEVQAYECAIRGTANYSAGVRDVFVLVIDTFDGRTTALPLAPVDPTTNEWRIGWRTYEFRAGRYHLKAYSHNHNGGFDLYSGPSNVLGWTVGSSSAPCSVTNP